MSYTSHGHHIPGSIKSKFIPPMVARCGGPTICDICARESTWFFSDREKSRGKIPERTFQDTALELVVRYHNDHLDSSLDYVGKEDLAIVWFTKTLRNWKALVTVIPPSGDYYEITHDGTHMQTYLDAYKKTDNMSITDEVIDNYLGS